MISRKRGKLGFQIRKGRFQYLNPAVLRFQFNSAALQFFGHLVERLDGRQSNTVGIDNIPNAP